MRLRYVVAGWLCALAGSLAGQTSAYPDTLLPKRLRWAIIGQGAYVAGGMTVLYLNWYADRERVPFHVYRDGRGYEQVDKVGHAYGAYVYSVVGYRSLRRAGVPKAKALLWGGGLGLYLQTPIEVMDGLYEGWGFSWGDMAANALGAGLVTAQEAVFGEQVVRMKFSFARSTEARAAYGYLGDGFGESLLNDYNGHTYWLSTGLWRLWPKLESVPWLNVAVGYGAGGMLGEFENRRFYRGNALPALVRHRQFYLSLDVDWERVPTRSRVLRAVLRGLNFVKVPLPALEVDGLGEVRGRWVYF